MRLDYTYPWYSVAYSAATGVWCGLVRGAWARANVCEASAGANVRGAAAGSDVRGAGAGADVRAVAAVAAVG